MSDSQSGTFVPPAAFSTAAGPVGPAGVEPATSSLSGTRSNQLSYEPLLARPATARLRPVAWSALPPAEAGLELRTSAHVSRPLVTTTTSESHILTRRPRLSITQIRKSCQKSPVKKIPAASRLQAELGRHAKPKRVLRECQIPGDIFRAARRSFARFPTMDTLYDCASGPTIVVF
jgi:hypothetical protein